MMQKWKQFEQKKWKKNEKQKRILKTWLEHKLADDFVWHFIVFCFYMSTKNHASACIVDNLLKWLQP